MRTNPVKRKLREGKPSFGTWLAFGDLYATRVLARMGFDWLTLDMEHSAIDWSQATQIFGAIADAGCVPLARVPEGSHPLIKRVLDAGRLGHRGADGRHGRAGPHGDPRGEVPPVGNRSIGGGMHSMNFGTTALEYYEKWNDEVLVVLQTESPQGVANAEQIYAERVATRSSSARTICVGRCARKVRRRRPTPNSKR